MSDDLRERLQRATPTPTRVMTLSVLDHQVVRQRRRTAGGAGLALVAAAVVALAFLLGGGGKTGGTDRDSISTINGGPSSNGSAPSPSAVFTGPSLTTSARNLADGATVALTGAGFPPNKRIALRQCLTNTDCGGFGVLRTVTSDGTGSFTTAVTVHETIAVRAGGTMWCGVNCLLFATSEPEPGATAVTQPFDLVSPESDAVHQCALPQMKLAYLRQPDQRLTGVSLTSREKTTCYLIGFPTVQFLDGDTVVAARSAITGKAAWVRVGPGESAHVDITTPACAVGETGPSATALLFWNAGGNTQVQIPLPAGAFVSCRTPGWSLRIGPFTAG